MPGGDENRKRPPLDLPYDEHFIELCIRYSKNQLHPEMLENIDIVVVMHEPSFINDNLKLLSDFMRNGGRVIWRTIGQSVPHQEQSLRTARLAGMEIVRYSPRESTIADNIGMDAVIRFAKYPDDFLPWTGGSGEVVNFTQHLLRRARFCGLTVLADTRARGINLRVYGPGNEALGDMNGGLLTYGSMQTTLSRADAYLYTGTYPASYTLGFIEALMAGVPTVAIGPQRGNSREMFPDQDTYEVHEILPPYWVSDDLDVIERRLRELLEDKESAKQASATADTIGWTTFSADIIGPQWEDYLG
jgi:hypothetical protein